MGIPTNDQEFSPTPAMKLYAFCRARAGKKAKDSKISKEVGVVPETISRWKQVNGFNEWLENEMEIYSAPVTAVLEQKALEMIQKGDFRFWSAMAEKSGFFKDPEDSLSKILRLKYKL